MSATLDPQSLAPARRPIAVWTALAVYAFAAVGSLVILTVLLKVTYADLFVPLFYFNDTPLFQMLIKGTLEHGWYLDNPSVGAPFGLNMREFPMIDSLHFFLVKLLGYLVRDHAAAANLYYALTFPATAVTTLLVLRRLKCSYGPALVGSLLFTFLPYHFFRGHHLWLAAYYLVPLIVLVVLWLFQEPVPFFRLEDDGRARPHLLGRRGLAAAAIALLLSCGGVYYAFFACYFLLIGGMTAALSRRRLYPLGAALLTVALIGGGVLVNYAPTLLHNWRHGANPLAVYRYPGDAETYGLKITHLLLPVPGHRSPLLARVRDSYSQPATPLNNENGFASLGLIGAAGFMFLVGRVFYGSTRPPRPEIDALSKLSLAAVLLATVGGLGSVFSFNICCWIRAYNRISVFIGFFALCAVALLLEKAWRRHARSGRPALLALGALGLIVSFGIWDQTSRRFIPLYAAQRKAYAEEADFVHRVEASVPAGAMIYQMPWMPFPEKPPCEKCDDYDHFRAYLHSCTLRWSHGALAGSEGEFWHQQVAALPLEDRVQSLCAAGFVGICLDRLGYADNGAEMACRLSALLGPPRTGARGRWAFFSLVEYAQALRSRLGEEGWQQSCDDAVNMVRAVWRGGFSLVAPEGEHIDRWCSARGELRLINRSTRDRIVRLEMTIAAIQAERAPLQINGDLFSAAPRISSTPWPLVRTVTVPPGEHALRFQCDARPFNLGGLMGNAVFRVRDFHLREIAERRDNRLARAIDRAAP